jgi:PadR family transcriptional regulator PadR
MAPQMTAQTLRVLALFLDDPTREWHGFDLIEHTGLKSGTAYPILIRLDKAGWLSSRHEDIDPSMAKRPPRRMYKLTGAGERAARTELAAHLDALAPAQRSGAPKLRGRLA